jgi:RNA polymerase sigma factor (sigma-70 family)
VVSSQPAVPKNRLSDVNWGLVFQKLVARGRFMASRAPDIFDGVSVEDVVSDAFLEFFADKNQLGWNPELGKLETFLWTVVRRMVLDRLRRARRQSSIEDESIRAVAEQTGSLISNPRQELDLCTRDRLEHLKKFAAGAPELEELLSVAADLDGPNVNQEIAARLHTSPEAIVNLKKRLQRRVKAEES